MYVHKLIFKNGVIINFKSKEVYGMSGFDKGLNVIYDETNQGTAQFIGADVTCLQNWEEKEDITGRTTKKVKLGA